MMSDLFAYGTLMSEDIMFAVCRTHYSGVEGILQDYRRWQFKGEVYPGMMKQEGGRVEGIIYRDISTENWNRLDAFEGERFSREIVNVGAADGTFRSAHTYVLKAEFAGQLSDSPWELESFLRTGKPLFESAYFGFDVLKS
ncbi:MAG: gamma-glutamylcyclotransferase [SAR324 cluster bacterium]|nr:gamma-glutamylcyclotransferase [SAR324 cluster bacterium]